MVLEGSTSDSAFNYDQAPISDGDTYDSPRTLQDASKLFVGNDRQSNPVLVDLDKLPRRFSFLLSTQNQPDAAREIILDSCRFAATIMHRPVTQEEADALANVYSATLRTASFGTPIGVIAGSIVAARGQTDFRFPFWKPMREGSKFTPDVFGPLRNKNARLAWTMARFGAYWIVGAGVGQIFMSSYALTSSLAQRARDPRLREFNQKLNEQIKNGQAKEVFRNIKKDPRPEDQEPGPRGTETWEQAQQRRRVQDLSKQYQESSVRAARQQAPRQVDDASPTGGMFTDEFLSDGQVSRNNEADVRAASAATQARTTDRFERPSTTTTSTTRGTASAEPGSSTSAWERLRQGAMADGAGSSGARSSNDRNSDSLSSFGEQDRDAARSRSQDSLDAFANRNGR